MTAERFLVTGAHGCLGAWVLRQLLAEGEQVVALDVGGSDHRLRLVLDDVPSPLLERVAVDITDLAALVDVVTSRGVTRIVHLAALQVPFCRADPSLGARVNVVGTVNVFEAARAAGTLRGPIAYASSVAAYDQADSGAEPSGHASTLYGVYKLANEGTARVYAADHGIPSLGLRPYVVYGVGRDQGLTSSPTFAMLAAAAGRPWSISYAGSSQLQLAADVAASFIAAARSDATGADVLNLRGAACDMEEVVAAIVAAAPAARGSVTVGGNALPFPPAVDATRLDQVIGAVPETSLADGVAGTIAHFRRLLADGRLAADELLARGV